MLLISPFLVSLNLLQSKFSVKHLGVFSNCLVYPQKLLERFGISQSRAVSIPVAIHSKLLKCEDEND